MTNHWADFQNADVIMNTGSNNVENHPLSSLWTRRAHENGATWIVVDPRYTRTAEVADIYCPIRPGTDIAFYGGLINYILQNDLWHKEYVLNYTNAAFVLKDTYNFDAATGLFVGWDESTKTYDVSEWGYATEAEEPWDYEKNGWVTEEGVPEFTPPTYKRPKKDMTLSNPKCVLNVMKEHYSRYTIETVCDVCGMDPETLEEVYSTYASTGEPGKAGTILYALGQTQHTYGSQNTRIMCITQLLLGNMGIAGGGVNALRGEPNVQGATDMAILVFDFPGYMKWPHEKDSPTLRAWLEKYTDPDGYYTNKPKFFISALKEWYGENATVENDYGYDWLPKVTAKDAAKLTTMGSFYMMQEGTMKGYFAWGQNPAHSDPNLNFVHQSLAKLDWLVSIDTQQTETAEFWKSPAVKAEEVMTECYQLPAALIMEKSGTITNSGRCTQWRYKACDPIGDSKSDLEICDLLYKKLYELYSTEGGPGAECFTKIKWDYYVDGKIDPRPVAWGFNGYTVEDGKLLKSFGELKADGSTSCAMWITTGFYANNKDKLDPSIQAVASRGHEDPDNLGLYPNWGYAWPANRRIIYNRASCDMQGKPWNPDKMLVEWTGTEWKKNDVPDFVAASNGKPVPPNDKAFMMKWEQKAGLLSTGMKDAPIPEHYEPFESPTKNVLNGSQNNPMIQLFGGTDETIKPSDPAKYPIAVTTYTVVEHWQSGTETRNVPAIVETQSRQFVELSKELAESKGIKNGDDCRIFNDRGEVICSALVTDRIKPVQVNGEKVHYIGMTHHWGFTGEFSTQETLCNNLTPNVGDPNSYIPEYKAFLADIEKA